MKYNDKKNTNFEYPLLIGELFERIGMDIFEALQETARQKSIIFCINYLTKYIKIRVLQEKYAEKVADLLKNIIIINECLNTILSDSRKEFNNI